MFTCTLCSPLVASVLSSCCFLVSCHYSDTGYTLPAEPPQAQHTFYHIISPFKKEIKHHVTFNSIMQFHVIFCGCCTVSQSVWFIHIFVSCITLLIHDINHDVSRSEVELLLLWNTKNMLILRKTAALAGYLKENLLQLGFKYNHATIASSETSWNEATSLKTGQTGPQAWRVW